MGKEAGYGQNGGTCVDAVDGRGSPLPTDPKVYLRSVVMKYDDATAGYQLNSFRNKETTRGYFENFRRSRFFKRHVYPAAVTAVTEVKQVEKDQPPRLLTGQEYEHKLAGFMFEQMAYADMVGWSMGREKRDRVVLSPKEVFELYTILYPNNPIIEGHFGQKFVDGVYQPDGIVIDPKTLDIKEVFEYKLFNGKANFEEQYNGAMKQKYRTQRRLFRNSQFTIVTPSDFERRSYHNLRNVEFEPVLVTNGEFGEFVQDTYYVYVNGGNMSLAEMISQRDADIAASRSGTLAPGVAVSFPAP